MSPVNPETKFVYLIGDPVEHSISPQMHNAAYKALKLNYQYRAKQVTGKDIGWTLEEFRLPSVSGFNVTVPHKESIISYLDEIDPSAKLIGAVNTVKNIDGKLKGFNTDSAGFLESLKQDGKQAPAGKKAVILGAGGASRAAAIALCGAKVSEITIIDIDLDKAKILIDYLRHNFNVPIRQVVGKAELFKAIDNCGILVNATPIGMSPKIDHSPLPDDAPFHKDMFVYDAVYTPPVTKLIMMARQKGASGITGLGMLVRQGAAGFKLFTGHEAPVDLMRKAAEEALGIA